MSYTYTYHQDADLLEVFFIDQEATASVMLTPDITLHFQVDERQATSLIFNNFSHLNRQAEYGVPALRLSVEQWPESLQPIVWDVLTQPPVNEWLTISTYRSSRMRRAVPLAAMRTTTLQVA